jgi:hypothetical protein
VSEAALAALAGLTVVLGLKAMKTVVWLRLVMKDADGYALRVAE